MRESGAEGAPTVEVSLSEEELLEKFQGCLAAAGSPLPAEPFFRTPMRLDELAGTHDNPGLR